MCTLPPFLHHGLAAAAAAVPAYNAGAALLTMAMYVDAPAAALRGHDDGDAADMDALLRDIDAVVHRQDGPACFAPPPVAAGAGAILPLDDAEFQALLRGIRSVHVPAAGLAPVAVAYQGDATPTTPPVAMLPAPLSYGDDDDDATDGAGVTINKTPFKSKKLPEPCEPYDGDMDASFRAMEKDPAERPSALYLWTTQAPEMTMATRAELVASMHAFYVHYDLAPATLHRAVSYVDRFLSATKIRGARQIRLLGAVAVFAAAKYEDRSTTCKLDADDVARYTGSSRNEVVATERELVAALGYRLSGPTAYTFVEHFTRHVDDGGEGSAVRSLAHHLADLALLDYRCVPLLPSALAASAIVLAVASFRMAPPWSPEELIKGTGYTVEELAGCMDAICEMHGLRDVWPGCEQMMAHCEYSYSLAPRPR
ncbi:hypothetical protein ACP4OV_005904 [Aristida adscensionis]